MVELNTRGQTRVLLLKPNTSMSWHANKLLLGILAVVILSNALLWTSRGAWVVLPFAGIELLVLGACLYVVCWKLNFRQVIHISPDQLLIEEGHYTPKRQLHLDRKHAAIAINRAQQPWQNTTISLYDHRKEVALGRFLNNEEHESLLELLQQAGLRVGSDSPAGKQHF